MTDDALDTLIAAAGVPRAPIKPAPVADLEAAFGTPLPADSMSQPGPARRCPPTIAAW